ncbi:HEPN family nuclease [Flavobacterium sp.]|uniref:HEPN family nuclease n=1 Tax=Flavobacterium sp. TaxID=239 RepID=UPI003752FED7
MNKERDSIPLWTWLNGQFLFQFQEELESNPKKTISEFFNNFCTQPFPGSNICNFYQTKNQGTIIILLYGLMVIPKEIWEKDKTSFLFDTRQKFTFNPPTRNNISTLDFLRLFRNSIAHANFSLETTNGMWTFWNIDRSNIKNFEVSLKHFDLGLFAAEIGKYYLNDVIKK